MKNKAQKAPPYVVFFTPSSRRRP